MKKKTRRLYFVLGGLLCCAAALFFMLRAFSENIVFFVTPSQILTKQLKADDPVYKGTVKLGGMVVAGSVKKQKEGDTPLNVFSITDGQAALQVHFKGILPDLFREGQSVVAIGHLTPGTHIFDASEVLAKHDETYMPPDVAQALRKSGKWDPRFGPPPDPKSWNTMVAPKQTN